MKNYKAMVWDWKEQIDIYELKRNLEQGWIHIQQVETNDDSYCIILSKDKIKSNEAQAIYDQENS